MMEDREILVKQGFQHMEGRRYAEAADVFARVMQAYPEASGVLNELGACLWLGISTSLRHLGQATVGGCKSRVPEELFLTYLLNPSSFPGGRLAGQLREAVSSEIVEQVRTCVRVAEGLFALAERKGVKPAPLLWRLHLLRGTGRYAEVRSVVAEHRRSQSTPADVRPQIERVEQQIALYQEDFAWLDQAAGGWVVPASHRVPAQEIGELWRVAKRAELVLHVAP